MIYKLEYKAEQVLTVPDIVDILVSFQGWQRIGKDNGWNQSIYYIARESDSSVRVPTDMEYYTQGGIDYLYKTISVTGPIIEYVTTIDLCDHSNPGSCPVIIATEIEAVSKSHVKVRLDISGNRGTDKYFCEYRKK